MLNHESGQGVADSFPHGSATDRSGPLHDHGQRPAKAPPSAEDAAPARTFPKGYRTFTAEMVLETLREHGACTRIEMFEIVFGPDNLSACGNPSSYLHKAIAALQPGRITERGYRDGSKIYQLTDQDLPLPTGLFTAEIPRAAGAAEAEQGVEPSSSINLEPVGLAVEETDEVTAPDAVAEAAATPEPRICETIREEARRFVEISGRAFLSIPYRDTEEAEALVSGIFADPAAPLPEQALVVGWRADLAAMAFASAPERRALQFAGLDVAKAEASFGEIVSGHGLPIGEHATAMRIVIDALSGASSPSISGKAWIEDAFATLRMPLPAATVSSTRVSQVRATPPAVRRREPKEAFVPRDPSEALKALALRDYRADSPAGQIMVRYAPLVRALFDGGHTAREIAETFVDEGLQIPTEMAVALVERIRTAGK